MVIDDARRLRRLAHRVADVEAFDAQRREIVAFEAERLGERARARLLRALLGQQPRERDLRILLGHRQPRAPLPLRLPHQRHLVAGLLGQQLEQVAARRRVTDDEHRRHAIAEVVLRDERVEHFGFDRRRRIARAARLAGGRLRRDVRRIDRVGIRIVAEAALRERQRAFDVRGEIRLVAEMAAAAHHREIHAHAPALRDHREDVDVAVAADLDRLLLQHGRERAHLVAHRRRLLELQLGRERMHLLLELLHHFGLPAEQEARGIRHIDGVVLGRNRADARRGAAPDLMQQARPRAVVEDRILAGAQLEHALQDLNALAHGPRTRERPEILILLVDRAAVVRHPRKAMRGQLQIRIRLVVAKQDVVARRERLDQIVFEQ